MPIPEDTIRRIRESVDIVEIISEYVSLQKRGGENYFGLCPFHDEKTPSFSVHSGRQTYHCFGCGEGGNAFTFLMKMEGIEFPDAVRRLAERSGITIDKESQARDGENEALYRANELAFKYFHWRLTEADEDDVKAARDYLNHRGIDNETVKLFGIGLASPEWDAFVKVALRRNVTGEQLIRAGLARRRDRGGYYDLFRGRLMFPIANAGGRIVAFGGRILHEEKEKPQPKYVNSPETAIYHKGRLVYGIPQARGAIRQEGTVILVEGYTDCIRMHTAGFSNTVAGLGTALTHEQASLLLRYAKTAIVLYDADTAGDLAAFRGADILIGAGMETRVALMPEGEDPDSLIQNYGREAMETVLAKAEPLVDFKISFFKRRGQLNTPEGRSEATHALVDTLRRVQDPITRQFILHDAAEKLFIDERTIAREVEKARRTGGRVSSVQGTPDSESMNSTEELLFNLLWILINHPEHQKSIFNFFHSADIADHPLRPVFDTIESAYIEGKQAGEADLYDALGDQPRVLKSLTQILGRPAPDNADYITTIVQEAPLRLRLQGIKRDLVAIREQMKEKADVGLTRRYQELMNEQRDLQAQLTEPS